MKIAIHLTQNSFSERWVRYCKRNNIPYKIVDAYRSDILQQVADCDAFMWHFHHADYRDVQFAKSLLTSLEIQGKKVFPNTATCWHFDDKIAQKYLLEAIGAPMVPTYVFYTEEEALTWIDVVEFPKVFKLKGGASASNVKLAKTRGDARRFVKQSFAKGYRQYRLGEVLGENWRKYKKGLITWRDLLRPLYYQCTRKYPNLFDHYHGRECGYAYFQEFIPNNSFDIRICVVGNRAFGLKRYTRENDFRASGSGNISYAKCDIDERCVQIAFDVANKLGAQSMALDFVFDTNNNPLIVEISYGYAVNAYDSCEGYWTSDLNWHEESQFDFCGWMVEDLMKR